MIDSMGIIEPDVESRHPIPQQNANTTLAAR
jgi:hypothetical protein